MSSTSDLRERRVRRKRGQAPEWFTMPPELAFRKKGGALRILTWNVHKGIGGLDRRYLPWRATEVIKHHDPDVVLLQEVAENIRKLRNDNQARSWAAALKYPYFVFSPNVRRGKGRWGNAILSRYPIKNVHHIDLSVPMKKKRGAVLAEIEVRSGGKPVPVHVVNVHLGLSGMERRWQMRRLTASRWISRLKGNSRIVLAGDMNDWAGVLTRRRGALHNAEFTPAWKPHHGSAHTFPSWYPVAVLDRVFLRGPVKCRHATRSRHLLARRASDHIPVIVDLELGRK